MRLSGRRGFTLIELLIVVVIIGLLAAIAVPKFAATKDQAFVASMRSDLRNLATSQEAYFSDYQQYYAGSLPNAQMLYNPSVGVSITVAAGTVTGWGATSTHVSSTRSCSMYIGDGGPLGAATIEGEIACTN